MSYSCRVAQQEGERGTEILKNQDCCNFLQQNLPRLGLRWAGFRRVRSQVCKRLLRRLRELGLADLAAYQDYLARTPSEWEVFDSLCWISISRFYRDRAVFEHLRCYILPDLAYRLLKAGEEELRCWSIGCGCGEEPYSLRIIWKLYVKPPPPAKLRLHIIATTPDSQLIVRAQAKRYRAGSLRDLPGEMVTHAFLEDPPYFLLKPEFAQHVDFRMQDVRRQLPEGRFHLILCRNLVLTYFSPDLQRLIMTQVVAKLQPGGFLVIGRHEVLPGEISGLSSVDPSGCIYRLAE